LRGTRWYLLLTRWRPLHAPARLLHQQTTNGEKMYLIVLSQFQIHQNIRYFEIHWNASKGRACASRGRWRASRRRVRASRGYRRAIRKSALKAMYFSWLSGTFLGYWRLVGGLGVPTAAVNKDFHLSINSRSFRSKMVDSHA
jgi:hypothetical protein